jgi:uncharacterized OB-fold protein
MSLENKSAIVTGGSQGIGAAIAQALGRQDANVCLVDRKHEKRARNLAEQIRKLRPKVIFVKRDVAAFADAKMVVEKGNVMDTRCSSCETDFFPPRADIGQCLASDMAWREVTGTGKLVSYSRLELAPVGFGDDLPYSIAMLDYGDYQVFGRLDDHLDLAKIKIGMPMTTVVNELPNDRLNFVFKVAEQKEEVYKNGELKISAGGQWRRRGPHHPGAARHNVLDIDMMNELNGQLEMLLADQALKCVVLLGDGPSWCAGVVVADHKPGIPWKAFAASRQSANRNGKISNILNKLVQIRRSLCGPISKK